MRICVIGAGPCGITAAKNLLDAGLTDLVVCERGQAVGGNWVFDPSPGHSSVFENTQLISSKAYSQYCDYPMPRDYPDYPRHEQLAAYFQGYARYFGLYPYIRFGTEVELCTPLADGGWRVTMLRNGTRSEETFDQLVVANGHHWQPRWPRFAGAFSGQYLHAHDYKRAAPFAGQRILVIGGGNSACDIAVDVARVAAAVDLSWRRGYHVIPKYLFGQPADRFQHGSDFLRYMLPERLLDRLRAAAIRLHTGSYGRYGLPEPGHGTRATHPTINSHILPALRGGRVRARRDVAHFEGHTVHFVDGESARYDIVFAATGYEISHPFFERSVIDYSEGQVPLYLRMIHPHLRSLHFIGLFQPLGCVWPAAELQAKILARRLTGAWQPPADLDQAIHDELAHPDVVQIDSPRHTITVDSVAFGRRLRAQLPRDYVRTSPPQRGSAAPKLHEGTLAR